MERQVADVEAQQVGPASAGTPYRWSDPIVTSEAAPAACSEANAP
jgi:hypothetical protein